MTVKECQQRLEVIGTEMNALLTQINSTVKDEGERPLTDEERAAAKVELDALLTRVLDLQAELIEVKRQLSVEPD